MVLMAAAQIDVVTRSEAGELAEIVNEMGLIVIATVMGNIGQLLPVTAIQDLQRILKPADAQILFGGHTDLRTEHTLEAAVTETDLCSHVAYAGDGA